MYGGNTRGNGLVYVGAGGVGMQATSAGNVGGTVTCQDEEVILAGTKVTIKGTDWSTALSDISTNTSNISSARTTTDGGCFQQRNKVVTVNGWGVGASSIIFNLPASWRPYKNNGVFSGFCYNVSNNTYYPVVGQFDTSGVPSVYAISPWGSAWNNYAIYNSSTDRRSNFQLYVTGSWLAN